MAPLVLGQSYFLPEARGVVWDMRKKNLQGCYEPLDVTAAPSSTINRDFVRSLVYEDLELLQMMTSGVNYKAPAGLDIVLFPHLKDLRMAFTSVESELLRMNGLGYNEFFAWLPFLPLRMLPNGCVARRLEPHRFRRKSDGSRPRKPLPNHEGGYVYSLNHLIGHKEWIPAPWDDEWCSCEDE